MLGKFEWEILIKMPPDEFIKWCALIDIEHQEERRKRNKAKVQSKNLRRY